MPLILPSGHGNRSFFSNGTVPLHSASADTGLLATVKEHVNNGRIKDAYDATIKIKIADGENAKNFDLLKTSKTVFETYQTKFPSDVDEIFYSKYFECLRSLIICHLLTKNTNDAAEILFQFDSILYEANEYKCNKSWWMNFLQFVEIDLLTFCADLILLYLKKGKTSEYKKHYRLAIYCYVNCLKYDFSKSSKNVPWRKNLIFNQIQAHQMLIEFKTLVGVDEWNKILEYLVSNQINKELLQFIFPLKVKKSTSKCFISSNLQPIVGAQGRGLPDDVLNEYFYETMRCADSTSFDFMIWFFLSYWDDAELCLTRTDGIEHLFDKSLNFTSSDLTSTGVHSLCQLDLKIFLNLSTHCAFLRNEKTSGLTLRRYSFRTTDYFSGTWQKNFWHACLTLITEGGNSDLRMTVSDGLELLRLKNKNVPPLRLIYGVASMLDDLAAERKTSNDDFNAITDYASIYWRYLEQTLLSGRDVTPKYDSPFFVPCSPLTEIQKKNVLDWSKRSPAEKGRLDGSFFDKSFSTAKDITSPIPTPNAGVSFVSASSSMPVQDQSVLQLYETMMKAVIEQNKTLGDTCRALTEQLQTLTLTNKQLNDQMNEMRLENKNILSTSSLGDHSKPAPGSWECNVCFGLNSAESTSCVSCKSTKGSTTVKPASDIFGAKQQQSAVSSNAQANFSFNQNVQTVVDSKAVADKKPLDIKPQDVPKLTTGFGDRFKPASGTWECNVCFVRNTAETTSCAACKSTKGGETVKPVSDVFGVKQQQQPAAPSNAQVNFGFNQNIFGIGLNSQQSPFAQNAQQTAKPVDRKDEPFKGFVGAGQPLFGNLAKPVEQPTRTTSESHDDHDLSGGHDETFEPTTEFKPLIPLPALIEVKTGEENEDILFKERAKLYRFDKETNEFKERGLGELKILRNKDTGRFRILMRRDQVLKLCANHYLTTDMKLLPMAKSEQAFTWQCQDFSEEELKCETVAAKFKTLDLAKKFKTVFEDCVSKLPADNVQTVVDTTAIVDKKSLDIKPQDAPKLTTGFGDLFKPAPGSWECKTCFVRNAAETTTCIACKSPKSGPAVKSASEFSFVAKPQQQPAVSSAPQVNFGFGQNIFGVGLNPQQPTFAQIAQQSAKPSDKKDEPFKGFVGAGQPLFGNLAKPVEQPRRTTSESHDDHDLSGGHDEAFEPTTDFKPLIPLPALIEVKTGEENEDILFKERAKLYRYDKETNEFKERGLGELKILRNKTTGRVRVLMRRDQVLKLCANHYLTVDMKLLPMAKSEQAFTWQCQDFSEEELKCETLAAKFKTADLAKKFKTVFEDCVSKLPADNVQTVVDPTAVTDKKSLDIKPQDAPKLTTGFGDLFKPAPGSWECNTCFVRNAAETTSCAACKSTKGGETVKPASDVFGVKQQQQPAAPSNAQVNFGFSQNIFGIGLNPQLPTFAQIAQQTAKPDTKNEPFKGFVGAGQPLFGNLAKPVEQPRRTTSESHDDHDLSGGHDEAFEPTTDFKPLIPLPALIEVKTGEENEDILFKERAKLYRFDKETNEFKERGLGELKILRNKDTGRFRILMRRDQVLKLCANHYLTTDMKLLPMAKSEQAFTWQCQDFSEEELKCETVAAKFKTVDLAKKFKTVFEDCVSKLPADNVQTVVDTTAIVNKKSLDIKPQDAPKLTTGFGDLFKPAPGSWECSTCFVRNAAETTTCIACKSPKSGPAVKSASEFSFVAKLQQQPVVSSASQVNFGFGRNVFGTGLNPQQPTFAQIAQQTAKPSDKKDEPFKGFFGAGQPLFGNLGKPTDHPRTTSESHDDHDLSGGHDEAFEPTTDFKPLIPLPALIEVKTGEENEDVLFNERAKLYRFVKETNEFKERGLGVLKILRNKDTGRFRILMRRDQVLKLCANHYLTADMKLLPVANSEQAFTWQCQDFSEDELKCETLTAKFKTVDLAKKFKTVFDDCVSKLSSDNVPTVVDTTKPQVTPQPTFAEVAKHAIKPETTSDAEVEIIFVAQASPKQKTLAEKFKLPPNFYLYESKNPCPGCIGCKSDEDLDEIFRQIDHRASSGASGSLTGDENGEDASSEEGKVLFSKNATLSTKEGAIWKPLGVGEILIVYDDDVDAYRCKFHNVDSAAVLMDHLIAQPCDLSTTPGKKGKFIAEWTAPDWAGSQSSSTKKTFQLKFSSALALKEFADLFKQGLEIARKNAIFYEMQSDFHLYPSTMPGDRQSLICEGLLKKMESYAPDKSKKEEE